VLPIGGLVAVLIGVTGLETGAAVAVTFGVGVAVGVAVFTVGVGVGILSKI